MTNTEVQALLWDVGLGTDEERQRACTLLLEAREEALGELVEMIAELQRRAGAPAERVAWRSDDGWTLASPLQTRLRHLGTLLAAFEDAGSLTILAQLGLWVDKESFLRVVSALERRAEPEDVKALVAALRELRQAALLTTLDGGFGTQRAVRLALILAEALVRIAQNHPTRHQELRATLPILRGVGIAPLKFLRLHQQLRALLSETSLPIPATMTHEIPDLPIPVVAEETL